MPNGVKSYGTYSYTGSTISQNQEFTFDGLVLNSLLIKPVGNSITVKINNETYTHSIAAGAIFLFESIRIFKLIVIESGVNIILEGTTTI